MQDARQPVHPLCKDPLVGMLDLLASTDDPFLRSVEIPVTIHLEKDPTAPTRLYRYVKDSGVLRFPPQKWTGDDLIAALSPPPSVRRPKTEDGHVLLDIIAVLITEVGPMEYAMDYMTIPKLQQVASLAERPVGVVQKYCPTGGFHSVLQCIWTPFLMVVEKRRCTNHLTDLSKSVESRTATAVHSTLSREVPVPNHTQMHLENVCRRIYSSILSKYNIMLTRMCCYFSSGGSDVTFLFTSSIAAFSTSAFNPPPTLTQKQAPSPIASPVKRDDFDFDDEVRRGASVTTTPAPSPVPSDEEVRDFEVEVVPFAAKGQWIDPLHADMVVVMHKDESMRPDSFLLVPSAGGTRPDVATPQYEDLADQGAHSPLATMSTMPSRSAPRSAKKRRSIAEIAARRYYPSPKDEKADGIHAVRRKYMQAAQAALIQGETRSMDIKPNDVDMIPAPARKHVIMKSAVVGAAAPPMLKTRPASAPASTLLSVLQAIDTAASTGYPISGKPARMEEDEVDVNTVEIRQAASRIARQRERTQQHKAAIAPPLGATNPPPQPIHPQPASSPPKPKGKSPTPLPDNNAIRELLWNNTAVTQGMLLHLPKSVTKQYGSSRAWLHDMEAVSEIPPNSPQATLVMKEREALLRQRRADEEKRKRRQEALERRKDGTLSGMLHDVAYRSSPHDERPQSQQRLPVKSLPRQPLADTNNLHMSITEAMKQQSQGGKRLLRKDTSWPRPEILKTPSSRLLDVLFSPKKEEEEDIRQREQMKQEAEKSRITLEKKTMEDRAKRLDALRNKRQKMQELREEARIRAQYSAIEAKYNNQLAVEYVEDVLYQAYSQSLEVRDVGKAKTEERLFTFTVPSEMWGNREETFAMLNSLGFTRVDDDDDDENGRAKAAVYTIPFNQVLLASVMSELARYKSFMARIFARQDVRVIQRLKELIAPAGNEPHLPMFEAVAIIRKEFGPLEPPQCRRGMAEAGEESAVLEDGQPAMAAGGVV